MNGPVAIGLRGTRPPSRSTTSGATPLGGDKATLATSRDKGGDPRDAELREAAREEIPTYIDTYHPRPNPGPLPRTPAEVAETWRRTLDHPTYAT